MEPIIRPLDKILLYKYLDKATHYMEFGSGGSTYQASIRPNIKSITTVESDLEWITKLKSIISHPRIQYNYIDIQALPNNYGNPGKLCSQIDMRKYSSITLPDNIDLILIDGRFRVACCLKLLEQISDDCIVIFDDFLNRKHYHIVLDYFNIIEQTQNKCLVVLKKKAVPLPSSDLISKYEIIKE